MASVVSILALASETGERKKGIALSDQRDMYLTFTFVFALAPKIDGKISVDIGSIKSRSVCTAM